MHSPRPSIRSPCGSSSSASSASCPSRLSVASPHSHRVFQGWVPASGQPFRRAAMRSRSACRSASLAIWIGWEECQSSAFAVKLWSAICSAVTSRAGAKGCARTRARASSRAIIQLFNKTGWRTRNGAMPSPVEFPTPSARRVAGSSRAARAPPLTAARCPTRSAQKARMCQTVSISTWNGALTSSRSAITSRSAAPNLPAP